MKNTTTLALVSLLALVSTGCSRALASTPGSDPAPAEGVQEQPAAGAAAAATAIDVRRVPVDGLPSIGNPDALVTIVEFTDYQCPYCQRTEQTIARLRSTYGDALRIVVAERPLPMHDRARPAAIAAIAADAQGKFEAMHTHLFALGGELTDDAIAGAAVASGLDLARFDADRKTAPLAPSEQLADRVGVKGTPTFFVNGRRVVGAQSYDTFHDVIEERLAVARGLVATGVRPRDVYTAVIANGTDAPTDVANLAGGADQDEGAECETNCKEGPDDSPSPDVVETVPVDGSPVRGPERATTTIVSFGDFQCPFSAKSEATLRAVESAHPNEVKVVFKNLPLPFHDHARLAARAALAAGAQGHFWDFHDRLFAHAGAPIDRAALDKIAADLGLDTARFARDIDDPATEARIARDEADAATLKVRGTPTFFVNGRRVVGAQPLATFEAAIARSR